MKVSLVHSAQIDVHKSLMMLENSFGFMALEVERKMMENGKRITFAYAGKMENFSHFDFHFLFLPSS